MSTNRIEAEALGAQLARIERRLRRPDVDALEHDALVHEHARIEVLIGDHDAPRSEEDEALVHKIMNETSWC